MKYLFLFAFLWVLISCNSQQVKTPSVSPVRKVSITGFEQISDKIYKVILSYEIEDYNPGKNVYFCEYTQLVNGKMKFGRSLAECDIEGVEGKASIVFKPKESYKNIPVVSVRQAEAESVDATYETININPPYELSITILASSNSEKCKETPEKPYWKCGMLPLAKSGKFYIGK